MTAAGVVVSILLGLEYYAWVRLTQARHRNQPASRSLTWLMLVAGAGVLIVAVMVYE